MENEPNEEAQRGRVTHPGPESQEGSNNGLNTNNNTGKMSTNSKQSESQGKVVTEGGKESQGKGPAKANYVDPPRKPRTARWSEEAADRPS